MLQAAGYVYAIENTVNNRCYIGSATNYKNRWHTHRSSLRRGVHHSFVLQRAWDKYGEAAFVFKLLLVCPLDQRIEYENRLMPLQSYNVLRTAKERLVRGGWSHTEAFRQKLSELNKGKVLSVEHRKKLSEAALVRQYDEAFKEKARRRQLGIFPSDATKAKLSTAVKNARSAEVENKIQATKMAYALVIAGTSVKNACKLHGISNTSFYKYANMLSLPLVGHAHRRGVQ